jgi:hypothetical protein
VTGRLAAEVELPDDGKVMTGRVKWAPGALDGVFSHHASAGRDTDRAEKLAELLRSACRKPST